MSTRSLPEPPPSGQRPRVESVPAYAGTLGGEVADLAAAAGLILDPWQRHVLDGGFGVLRDGRWSAFEVAVVVPRQNGKGSILEAVELAGLFLFGERLILHSAHELKTSMEAFRRVLSLVTDSDFLRKQVSRVTRSHGDEGIELLNGNRLRFTARSTGAGRGFTGDRIILDEAYELGPAAMAALLPTLSARPNPQLWYASSAGMATSVQLHAVRTRGLSGTAPALAYYEWSADPRADPDDPAAAVAANPAMAVGRITPDFVRRERAAMPEAEFLRERLGIWDDPRNVAVIPPESWGRSFDGLSTPGPGLAFGVDATPDRSAASVGVASKRLDGRWHVELLDNRRGVTWVAGRVAELRARWGAVPVILDAAGPAASLLPGLVDVATPISSREYVQACGGLYDAVVGDELRHLGQGPLNAAVSAARRRPIGDSWGWARRDLTDISPLVAVTLAMFGVTARPAEKPRTGGASFYD